MEKNKPNRLFDRRLRADDSESFAQQTTQSPLTLERALEVQDLMVRRGLLTERAHDVVNGITDAAGFLLVEQTADGVAIQCKCGRHMLLDSSKAERTYALHVASALGISLALAA